LELALEDDDAQSILRDSMDDSLRQALPGLQGELQQLLHDAMDLLREIGEANDKSDLSYMHLPSISPHWQNRGFREWIVLIELLRDSWLEIQSHDPGRATSIAQDWFHAPYPIFKRLALFAASHNGCINSDQWVSWLVSDDAWWLWSVEVQRETMRLLVLQGAQLSPVARDRLETAILAGPPRAMFREDLDENTRKSVTDHSIWLHLAKLGSGGGALGKSASQRLAELSASNPDWTLSSNERDEFPYWMSGTSDPDYQANREIDIAPRKRRDLAQWLKQPLPEGRFFYENTWRDVCRTRFFHSLYALCDISQEGLWPIRHWREALQAWSEEGKVQRSWRYAAPLVQAMPEEILQELAHGVSWWLEAVSKSIDRHETIFLNLCRRLLALTYQDEADADRPVTRAINHPVGLVTTALLALWFKRQPNDNDTLPADIKPLLTSLCDTTIGQFRHGRILLASRLIALFRVDRPWTEALLLPLFDWTTNAAEAKGAWEGFLWSPRLYRPLLTAFKQQFLDTARHYSDLGEHSRQFAGFLTYAALDPAEGYTSQDFQAAIEALPQSGLLEVAQALSQALEGSGEQREHYWKNRIEPFWQQIWPKSLDLASGALAAALARLPIAARGEFPSAVAAVLDWMRPVEQPHYVVHRLHESGLAGRFPEEALSLLDAIISDQSWVPSELGQCLEAISTASPPLRNDQRYRRLDEQVQTRRIG
jgi:hypothetical protein